MRQDLNLRHLVLETSALTGLSYAPELPPQHTEVQGRRYLFHRIVGYKVESFSHPLTQILEGWGVGESARGTARATPDNVSPTGLGPVPPP